MAYLYLIFTGLSTTLTPRWALVFAQRSSYVMPDSNRPRGRSLAKQNEYEVQQPIAQGILGAVRLHKLHIDVLNKMVHANCSCSFC